MLINLNIHILIVSLRGLKAGSMNLLALHKSLIDSDRKGSVRAEKRPGEQSDHGISRENQGDHGAGKGRQDDCNVEHTDMLLPFPQVQLWKEAPWKEAPRGIYFVRFPTPGVWKTIQVNVHFCGREFIIICSRRKVSKVIWWKSFYIF